ncbi:unnamed protein product [Lupinus luteus]|uniref:Uncharacterized protein n=1 Tax=Lupinus luteus TaxID=3873 RepID=A0AAV1XWS3_LUPLU
MAEEAPASATSGMAPQPAEVVTIDGTLMESRISVETNLDSDSNNKNAAKASAPTSLELAEELMEMPLITLVVLSESAMVGLPFMCILVLSVVYAEYSKQTCNYSAWFAKLCSIKVIGPSTQEPKQALVYALSNAPN